MMMRYWCAIVLAWAGPASASDFGNEVMAVLSRAGCNSGTCHGNLTGKGGFKLSLRGEDPAADFRALTQDQLGRRINRPRPDDSLLLLKAAGAIPHEGGIRAARGSAEYRILRAWIAAGARSDTGARLVELSVQPPEALIRAPNDHCRLRAFARFADGSSRDVTGLCAFDLASTGVASIDAHGVVRRLRPGQTTALVRYLDQQVAVAIAFLPESSPPWPAGAEAINRVDQLVFARMRKLGLIPAPVADDATFLRRVYLDTLGILPTATEAKEFLADASTDKRARLIDRLLARPEFDDFWAQKWADVLHAEERTLDAKGVRAYHAWLRQQSAQATPLNELARTIIAAQGSTYASPETNFYRALREPYARAEAAAQVFLGVRLQCAKCHNHPFDRWTQDDYHAFAALFARVGYRVLENRRTDNNDPHAFIGEQIVFEARDGELKHPRDGSRVAPRVLGGKAPVADQGRLQAFADWVADPANPFFARTQANRIWFHLLGRGLVEPTDDFRLANPPAYPEALEFLAQELVASKFDLRHLTRLILNSRVYQSAPAAADDPDPAQFTAAIGQPLEAEQLLDALGQVLEQQAKFEGHPPGVRAGQLPELAQPSRKRDSDAARFLRLFGKPDRLLSCECERSDDTTVVQAAQLLSGDLLQRQVSAAGNRIGRLLAARIDDSAMLDEFYLAALARYPRESERALALRRLAEGDRRAGWEDLVWSLLNTKEFLLRR